MKILSIETSCDETAVSLVEAHGDFPNATYCVLGNALFSQIDIHREYGGVFPAVAKREHAKTLVPMLKKALEDAGLLTPHTSSLPFETQSKIVEILTREEGLSDALLAFAESYTLPHIDAIAVTSGPGLEPTLWVGISFAKALGTLMNVPVIPANHMEGHVLSSIFDGEKLPPISFPALALLISGGHTELVRMDDWQTYTCAGETRDDAAGEAFDKVARMLGLQYPGGPEISARARSAREKNLPEFHKLPRPMLDSGNLDFSFSGLKTAVRYAIQDKELTQDDVEALSRDFEDAVTEVLLKKTQKAVDTHNIQTIIVGGGVSANTYIREKFEEFFTTHYPHLTLYFPPRNLSTDNSIMIALAGHAHLNEGKDASHHNEITADGNWSL
jgi:N6-L-threonylcarbamoyladenine synthase